MGMGNNTLPDSNASSARDDISSDGTVSSGATGAELKGEEKYRILFDRMLNGFALCEVVPDLSGEAADFRYIEVNPAFERITGLKSADIVGRTVREIFPDTEDSWIEIYGKVALTGEPESFSAYHQQLDKHLEIRAFSPVVGQVAVIFDDITSRVRIEQTLRESEFREKARAAELAALMDSAEQPAGSCGSEPHRCT